MASPVFLTNEEWDELGKLVQVKERSNLARLLQTIFETPTRSTLVLQTIAEDLSLDPEAPSTVTTCSHIYAGLKHIISEAVYRNAQGPDVLSWFPESFHVQLAKLLATLIIRLLPQWRAKQIEHQVGLPKLQAIDWRIDIKTASELNQQMSVPALLVQLTVEEESKKSEESQLIHFELTPATLDSMLEGLTKIRTQLGAIAGSSQPSS